MKKFVMFYVASTIAVNTFCQIGNKKKDTIDPKKNISEEAITPWDFPLYTIISSNVIHAGKGRLTAYLPKDTTITITKSGNKIKIPVPIYSTLTFHYTDTIKVPVDLAPRNYGVGLNGVRSQVPIEKGKITRLKAGFLIITTLRQDLHDATGGLEWIENVLLESSAQAWTWTLRKPGSSGWEFTGKKGKIFALPPGEYSISKEPPFGQGDYKHYKVIIKDGEWVVNGVRTN